MATPANLFDIKYRFHEGQNIQIKSSLTDKLGRKFNNRHRVNARIIKFYDDFMLVKTRNYYMTVPYRDILIGDVLIKEVSMC